MAVLRTVMNRAVGVSVSMISRTAQGTRRGGYSETKHVNPSPSFWTSFVSFAPDLAS